MEFEKIKNKGQGRLFKSDYLEMATKTQPVVIYSIYFPVIIFLLYYAHSYKNFILWHEVLLFFGGVFAWTLFEYVIHRWLFHMVAESPRAKKINYAIHGIHHEFPRDKERLFMPPVPSLIVACIVFSVQYALLGWNVLAFFPGFLFGYLAYGSMHFAIHAFPPPRLLKALWRNHHLHHYKSTKKGFGVSSVLWDHIFGTVPSKEEQ